MCVDANAITWLQPAGGQGQPGLLGTSRHGAALLHDLHLWPIQGEQDTTNTTVSSAFMNFECGHDFFLTLTLDCLSAFFLHWN